MRGRYIGPIIHLKDKTCLLQYRVTFPESYFAQFDWIWATRSGQVFADEWFDHEPTDETLAFGWHEFPRNHFDVVYTEGDVFANMRMPEPVAGKARGA